MTSGLFGGGDVEIEGRLGEVLEPGNLGAGLLDGPVLGDHCLNHRWPQPPSCGVDLDEVGEAIVPDIGYGLRDTRCAHFIAYGLLLAPAARGIRLAVHSALQCVHAALEGCRFALRGEFR